MLTSASRSGINKIVKQLEETPELNLQDIMKLKGSVVLDPSQAASLKAALKQKLSLIQGPPGTGKSYIGALAVKASLDNTDEKHLIICHTNQALDQFIQDIRKIGVKDSDIVRLGGMERTDPANHSLLISSLRIDSTLRSSRDTRSFVKDIERQVLDEAHRLEDLYRGFTSLDALRGHLDGLAMKGDPRYSQAFEISLERNGTSRTTSNGSVANRHYLLQRWIDGEDPGVFPEKKKHDVWNISLQQRKELSTSWWAEISKSGLSAFLKTAEHHDDLLSKARNANGQVTEQIIRSKRIIACTTSGAAKYPQVLAESPGIIVVEEAGTYAKMERVRATITTGRPALCILLHCCDCPSQKKNADFTSQSAGQVLESHIITALNPSAKQLIMIGDHKQLRPFVNYNLSVEKGDGYDLNRSMFERLVLKGYPHQVLAQQHRMRPEISALPRQLTYPDLIDAPETQNRPDLRGFSDNVIFINHDQLEDTGSEDPETVILNTSKCNTFEAEMALMTVKYLLLQNYDARSVVVLTPYLGQLKKLQEVFSREFDAVLSNSDIQKMEQNGIIKDGSEVKSVTQESVDEPVPAAFDADPFAFAELLEVSSSDTHTAAGKLAAATKISTNTGSSTNAPKAKPKIQISTIGK